MPVKIRTNGEWVTVSDGADGAAGSDGGVPSGTRMIFQQTAAPTGWTKDTSNTNQRALRVVSGAASSGGTVNFTTAFSSSRSTTGGSVSGHILSTSQVASHFHNFPGDDQLTNANGKASWSNVTNEGNFNYDAISNYNSNGGKLWRTTTKLSQQSTGDLTHGHGFTNPSVNLAVKYLDVIIAQKD